YTFFACARHSFHQGISICFIHYPSRRHSARGALLSGQRLAMSTVAILHYSAPPIVGGVESVIDHHARMLAAAGHSVRILAGRGQATDRRIALQLIPLLDSRHSRVLDAKQSLDAGQLPAGWANLVADIRSRLEEALADV